MYLVRPVLHLVLICVFVLPKVISKSQIQEPKGA